MVSILDEMMHCIHIRKCKIQSSLAINHANFAKIVASSIPFFLLIASLNLTTEGTSWALESPPSVSPMADETSSPAMTRSKTASEKSRPVKTSTGREVSRGEAEAAHSTASPLFRSHDPRFYPPKTVQTAVFLSAVLPGLGQTYAGRPGKGLAFFVGEIALLSVAGFHLDRAAHYDDLANRFTTGFYDSYSNAFLTANQGHVKSRSHIQLGVIFLAGGIGVHIWNILDAAKTVNQYNERRFQVQVQQTIEGEHYIEFSHRF